MAGGLDGLLAAVARRLGILRWEMRVLVKNSGLVWQSKRVSNKPLTLRPCLRRAAVAAAAAAAVAAVVVVVPPLPPPAVVMLSLWCWVRIQSCSHVVQYCY